MDGESAGKTCIAPESPSLPGWYSDPFGRFRARWWDGQRWTAYAADGVVRWDAASLREERPPSATPPGIGVAVAGFGCGVGLSLGGITALAAAGYPGGRAAELLVGSIGLWLGLTSACMYVSRRRGTGSLRRDFNVTFQWRDLGFGLAGSVVARMLAAAAVVPIPLPLPTRRIGESERVVFEGAVDTGLGLAVLVLVTCIGAPLFEELFFRGLVQGRLEARLGLASGIAVTSLLFGAAHLIAWQGPWTLVYAWAVAASGAVLGLMRHVSGRLGPPMAAHAFFNAQVMVIVVLLA
ncbi:MAG: CPBP family glutamic-type intramembrane protease [Acidimicrobiales bacterium]